MITYIFRDQPAAIPGLPGLYSNCLVTVEADEILEVKPLPAAGASAEATELDQPQQEGE